MTPARTLGVRRLPAWRGAWVVGVLLFAACEEGLRVVTVSQVAVTPASATLVLGDSLVLLASPSSAAGVVMGDVPVTWASDDTTIATVRVTGTAPGNSARVRAVGVGQARIVVEAEGARDTVRITVVSSTGQAMLSGVWDWTEQLTAPAGRVCSDTGSYTFVQTGATFRGLSEQVGICVLPFSWGMGSGTNNHTDSVVDGTVDGTRLRFVAPPSGICTYVGEVSATFADSVSGTATCADSGFEWTGTWQARRGPLGSLVVAPMAVTRVIGFGQGFEAREYTPDGHRAFGRPVIWSNSDPAVVELDTTGFGGYAGVAFARGEGRAVLTASAERLQASATFSVPAPLAFSTAATGDFHSCGLAGGAAYCWSSPPFAMPVAVPNGHRFASLSALGAMACGLDVPGTAWCWDADARTLAGGEYVMQAPVEVANAVPFVQMSVGMSGACGLDATGTAYCWGLRNGTVSAPVPVAFNLPFTFLSVGAVHTCALTASGTAYCWGGNAYGQLGDGTRTDRPTPAPVSGSLAFSTVSAGASQTCGITTTGAAYCWGINADGELGNGSLTASAVPVAVSGALAFTAIAVGRAHVCAITTDGAAWCWGANDVGQLGNGTLLASSVPTPVAGGLTFRAIAASGVEYQQQFFDDDFHSDHTCAVSTAGETWCWGDDSWGQVGVIANRGVDDIVRITAPARVAGQP